ncbi:organic cation transporter protein-like isoform X2 [Temnothorax longispinosus]|uniref:organic cation transporter protein-like isoform X2 n=1 Tax=Temnothorax longispinosus TaxID=300112 RepID=UPI003A9A5C87
MPPQEKFPVSAGVSGNLSPQDASPDGGLSASASSDGLSSVKGRKSGDDQDDQEQPKDIDFDDLLPHVGEFGTYQRILFVLMIPFAFFVAWVYFSQIFITLVPEKHWCRVPELENLPVEERIALAIPVGEDGYSKCTMYDVNYTELLLNGIREADPNWPTKGCSHGWEFNFTDIPYETVATELGWVCEHSALPTTAQSVFFVGAIFGGLIFGWIADRYGRIPALVGANVTGFLAGVATVLAGSFWEFALCRFFVGFAFDNCFTMMYILACILPWIAYFLANWRLTCITISVPLALAVAAPWLVPESARWLVSQGQVEKAIGILGKFERMNGTKVPENVYQQFRETCARVCKEQEADKTYSVVDLFKSPRLRNVTILLIIIWMVISLVFDGHVRNVNNLGLDVFVTFTIAAFTELPADTFLTLVLDRWGRRWLACGTMVISGIFSIWASAISNNIYSATLAIVGRFWVNISYNIGLQYAAEVLPTVVRAQGVALIHIMGYVASILAPFVVYLDTVSPILPLLVLGVMGILGGLLTLLLPETLDKDLPQTLQDGEDFGKNQKLWDMPCLSKKKPDVEAPPVAVFRSFERSSFRSSMRASIRGETLRSSMIQRSSIRSRKSVNAATEESKCGELKRAKSK